MAALAHPAMDLKVYRMIAGPRHETAAGAGTSARTLGSGGVTTGLGVVDKKDWDWALIVAGRSQINSTAKFILRFFHQSGAATLTASATSLFIKSITSGSKSGNFHVIRVKLEGLKRYLNCRVCTVGTCGYPDVWAILLKGKEIPPSFGSAATVANV